MKKKLTIVLVLFLLPFHILAYSNNIIVGGDSIGIEIYSKGIYVVGFYPVKNHYIAKEAGFQIGDRITKINNQEIESLSLLNNILKEEDNYSFHIIRGYKEFDINLPIKKDENVFKTGLYIKNQVNGIGTLSYIDPETKIFGALGHEIIESSSNQKFLLENGKIYKAEVNSIRKSDNQTAGEKNATMIKEKEYGTIHKNEISGIYGIYQETIGEKEILPIGKKEEIKKGEATIRTVIKENKVESFPIQIIRVEENEENKNILFEIKDENLLKETGGIIQGMSGSPIIQNNKIIGVVNYVIVEDAKYGYGIFIETMLEEGDRLFSKTSS